VTSSWDDARRAFADAGRWFVGTTAAVGDRWNQPGLGEWDLRTLVGHTSRSFVTVETYLGRPATAVEIATAADYYRATRSLASGPDVSSRARDAAAALGDDPAAFVAELAARVTGLVERCTGTELVTTIAGGMRLADYLPSRTFELVVHTCDLATALGLPPEVPGTAARAALDLVAELAVADGSSGPLLLAATGRSPLPAGFSVL
jgi:uncharacterized protein (TIGR03083 family)